MIRRCLSACCLAWILIANAVADPAVESDRWIRGSLNGSPHPIWGHTDGLRIGLVTPRTGPRGLLRVYAPYLDQPENRVINFIAVEPVPKGSEHRGLSELEFSLLDTRFGKRFWSADDPSDPTPRSIAEPVRGTIKREDGRESLCVYIMVEPFVNGAHVYLKLTFWQ